MQHSFWEWQRALGVIEHVSIWLYGSLSVHPSLLWTSNLWCFLCKICNGECIPLMSLTTLQNLQYSLWHIHTAFVRNIKEKLIWFCLLESILWFYFTCLVSRWMGREESRNVVCKIFCWNLGPEFHLLRSPNAPFSLLHFCSQCLPFVCFT